LVPEWDDIHLIDEHRKRIDIVVRAGREVRWASS